MYYYRPKSDLRACDTPLKQFVGIDIAKASFTACVCIYTYGDMAFFSDVASFKNTKTGFNQLMKWTRKEALKTLPVGFLMESTGVYYEELAAYRKRLEQPVCVVNGKLQRSTHEYAVAAVIVFQSLRRRLAHRVFDKPSGQLFFQCFGSSSAVLM